MSNRTQYPSFSGIANASAPAPNEGDAVVASYDLSNNLRILATVNASVNGFTPNGNYATLAVSNVSANVALPAGATVVVFNTATVIASINLGTTSGVTATTSQIQLSPGGAIGITVGSNTYLAGITSSGSGTLIIVGGSGLFSGFAGSAAAGASNVNVSQVGGNNTDTNSGLKSAGTIRVVLATDQPALTNALKVDGSAVTQPVSGTFWQATQPVSGTVTANAGTNLNTSALALESGGNLAGLNGKFPATQASGDGIANPTVSGILSYLMGWDATNTVYRRLQVDAGTGTLKVDPGTVAVTGTFWQTTQPVSGTVTANQGGAPWQENVTQWAGTAVDTNSGTKSAGTLRVVLATDQPQLTNKLLVTPDANSSVNLNQIGSNAVVTGGVNGSLGVGGLAAPGASVSGNPMLNGARAATANPTAVTDGQAVDLLADILGKLVIIANAPRALKGVATLNTTDASSHTLIAAGGAGVFTDIEWITIANTSGTTVEVDLSDGTNTIAFEVPTTDMRGITVPTMITATTANTAWTIQAASGVSTIKVATGYAKRTG